MGYTADERLAASPEESRYLGAVFTLGAQVGTPAEDPARAVYVVEVTEVSPIRVPSGRLVVASPWPDDSDWELPTPAGRELKDRIPPGVHRVQVSWTEAPYEYNGEQFDGREEVAVRLLVSDAPVACWEAALGVGESIERVVPGERPIFDSEENMGSFADATAWPSLTEPFRQFWLDVDAGKQDASRATESLDESFERVSDEALEADLVTFPTGGGTIVWLGRTETGSIASIVTTGPAFFHNEPITSRVSRACRTRS
ncbi:MULTISPECIES: DUF4241 domain-containing protein [Streptomyces]|uniref:DUF4241 domain-containing protein n=1 Tax=Streptomyces TaxID=1883 RepID=UPI0001802C70|nr:MULTISPECIES: DUF4241 domain-containing protein [Streptomyces]MYT03125.1 DUF4241 domain-containing protein [Streptomyces sp. SID5470]